MISIISWNLKSSGYVLGLRDIHYSKGLGILNWGKEVLSLALRFLRQTK
jgi:hypothetical protein